MLKRSNEIGIRWRSNRIEVRIRNGDRMGGEDGEEEEEERNRKESEDEEEERRSGATSSRV